MDGENIQISAVVLFIHYYRHSMEISREITACIKTHFDGMILLFFKSKYFAFVLKMEHFIFLLKWYFSS